MKRLRPVRAGIVNLWDYTDHEFVFHGGRLVLRGPNGSGKTKALELLFPFLLDANITPQRLDPFSGTGRTMRDNLLYRPGRDTVTGYAWLELADTEPDEAAGVVGRRFVIGAGLRAQRSRNDVKSWFFVTERGYGDGWSVLDAERQPHTETGLTAVLGTANVFSSAREYRERLDRVLFGGIGVDRYAALLQLVLFLRRPQLAKDLDLMQLSNTLSAGLRPVDDDLLAEGATSFEDLEAVQRELDRLERSCAATEAFLRAYRPYVRVVARRRVDAALGAIRSMRAAERQIELSRAKAQAAGADASAAHDALGSAQSERVRLEREREAQIRSEAYQSIAQLEDLRRAAEFARTVLAQAQADLDRVECRLDEAGATDADAHRRADDASTVAARAFQAMRASALGVVPHRLADIDALEQLDDPTALAIGVVRERREDHRAVLDLLAKAERAAEAAANAERELAVAFDALARSEEALAESELAVDAARTALAESITEWSAAWAWVGADDRDAFRIAAQTGEPPNLKEIALARAAVPRDHLRGVIARLEVEVQSLVEAVDGLEAELAAVAGERDDAPPLPIVARRDRHEVLGAPLWRLVDFAPGVSEQDQAGLAAALLAAGLLDAWVPPDGSGPSSEDGLDSFLRPSFANAGGPTLATVLVAETDPALGVDPERVTAILRSVGLGRVGVSVDATGAFSLGPLHGRTTQERAGYIGATARSVRRARRIEELRARIASSEDALLEVRSALEAERSALGAIDSSVAALPSPALVVSALKRAEGAAREIEIRRSDQRRRDGDAAEASARRAAARDALTDEARRRAVPADRDALASFAAAVDGFEGAVRAVGSTYQVRRSAQARLVETARSLDVAASDADRQRSLVTERTDDRGSRDHEYATLLDSVGVGVQQVQETLQLLDRELADVARTVLAADARWQGAFRSATQAEAAAAQSVVDHGRSVHVADDAKVRLVVLRRPELRAALEIDDTEDLDSFLPVVAAACRDAVATDEQRQSRTTAVRNAFQVLERDLGTRHAASLDDVDEIDVAMVADDDGRASVAAFAARITQRRDDQRTLLSAQERQVLEDTLIDSLCRQLFHRLRDAEDQVKRMNAALSDRRTTSGTGVQLVWSPNDAISEDQKQIVKLLDRDPAMLGSQDRGQLREALAAEIKTARALDGRSGYYEVLGRVLDYRRWRAFGIRLLEPDGTSATLTKKLFNTKSGGEKATILHLPLFAAAAAHFDAAAPHAPRLVALDEAFAGIDAATTRELLGLTVQFDLDVFLTGHDFWGAVPEVPKLSIITLSHRRDDHIVSSLNARWDGTVLTYDD